MVDRCLSPCLLATSLDHILALYIAIGFISTYPHIGDLHIGDLHIGDLHIGDLHIGDLHIGDLHIGDLHIGDLHIGDLHIGDLHIGDLHIGDLHIGDLHIGDLHIGDLHIMPCMWCVLLFHLNGDMVSTEEMGNVNADILISVLVVT